MPFSCFLFRPRKSREKRRNRSHTNVSNTLVTRSSTPPAQTATFAFTGESGYTLGFRRKIAHSRSHAETGAFPPSTTVRLCAASEILFIPPRFYISNSSISDHLSSRFSTSPTNGPRSLSRAKVGTHSPLLKGSHTGVHRAKQGAFRMGVASLPSIRAARSRTSPGRVSGRQTLPLWGLGRGCSRRTQKACGTAMRLCASLSHRRRGPAGLRDFFRFCRSCGLYALFQILLSVFQTLQLVLFLCKPYLSSFLFPLSLFLCDGPIIASFAPPFCNEVTFAKKIRHFFQRRILSG